MLEPLAPDMLFCWKPWMPDWFNAGVGMFALGPYFNLLPLLTVVLMIWQQKVLTPPPTDEQAIMMQKMMKYMMLFMGLMFFKVASGLCIYIVIFQPLEHGRAAVPAEGGDGPGRRRGGSGKEVTARTIGRSQILQRVRA